MKRQPIIKDTRGNRVPRIPAFSTLDPRIRKAIIKEVNRYGVSASFVIANALAFTFGIEVEDYRAPKRRKS